MVDIPEQSHREQKTEVPENDKDESAASVHSSSNSFDEEQIGC